MEDPGTSFRAFVEDVRQRGSTNPQSKMGRVRVALDAVLSALASKAGTSTEAELLGRPAAFLALLLVALGRSGPESAEEVGGRGWGSCGGGGVAWRVWLAFGLPLVAAVFSR